MRAIIVSILTVVFLAGINYADCNHSGLINDSNVPLKCTSSGSNPKKEVKKAPKKTATEIKNGKRNAPAIKEIKKLKTEKDKKVLSVDF